MNINNRKFWVSSNKDNSKLTVTWINDVTQEEIILISGGDNWPASDLIARLEQYSQDSYKNLMSRSKGVLK